MCIDTDAEKLNDDMHATLKQLQKMVYNLSDIKSTNKIELIIESNKSLSIDTTDKTNLSDEDINKLVQKVGIADRVYNTQLDEYKKLVDKDNQLNNGMLSKGFERSYNKIIRDHKNLFKYE
jgi:hypothetical protein